MEAGVAIQEAISLVRRQLPQTVVCVFCKGMLVVHGASQPEPRSIWFVTCPCRKSNTTVKGL